MAAEYGIAFDIGTTTIVGALWDLDNKKEMGTLAVTNPQTLYGADVITRIQYTMKKEGNLTVLTDLARGCLSKMTLELCDTYAVNHMQINRVSVAANTTMSHIFLGYDPLGLARAPFAPAYQGVKFLDAVQSQLPINDDTKIIVLPNIAGHVGGDITAGILASGLMKKQGLHLFIDIGTNGEIVLTDGRKTLACSTAAGPAFEGAGILWGMRAAPGAIHRAEIRNGRLEVTTIENKEPIGICGTGLIDVISSMLTLEKINKSGKLMVNADEKGEKSFVIAAGSRGVIKLTQQDIREVQMAKGAIIGGIKVMLRILEKTENQIDSIMVAGAFGSHIDKKSAIKMRLLPDIDENKIHFIGNAARDGAALVLTGEEAVKETREIAESVAHIELASHPDFQKEYMLGMGFGS